MPSGQIARPAGAAGPTTHRARGPRYALWLGLFGAPTAWSIQLMASYALVAHSCFPSDRPLEEPVLPLAHLAATLVGVVALAICAASLAVAIRQWRSTRPPVDARHGGPGDDPQARRAPHRERVHFMAFAGILVSTVFLFAAVMNTLPLLMLPTCGR